MELKIVDFETAKKLNEIGYQPNYDSAIYYKCDCVLDDGDCWVKHRGGEVDFYPDSFNEKYMVEAPTYELVKHWLMEEKKLYIDIAPVYELHEKKTFKVRCFKAIVRDLNDIDIKDYVDKLTNKGNKGEDFTEYDDALEWGIKESIGKCTV